MFLRSASHGRPVEHKCLCRLLALPRLPWLPHLQELNLQDNEITSVQPLQSCPQLTALNLSFNAIADLDSMAAISPCTSLRSLSLHDNPVIELPGYSEMRLEVCSPALGPGLLLSDHDLPRSQQAGCCLSSARMLTIHLLTSVASPSFAAPGGCIYR